MDERALGTPQGTPDAPLPAGLRIGIALAMLLFLGVLVLWWPDETRGAPTAATTPTRPSPTAAVAPEIQVTDAVASVASEMRSEPGSDEVQLCDGTWVKAEKDGQLSESTLTEILERTSIETAKPVMAAMQADSAPRSKAAAHYFLAGLGTHAKRFFNSCETDACRLRWRDVMTGASAHRDALAGLAADGADPLIYAWAHRLCAQAGADEGRCQQISARQWAHLDPANAVPWFHLADEARWRRDAVALDDAMFHVASATRYEWGRGRLLTQVATFASTDQANQLGITALLGRVTWVDQMGFQWNGPNLAYCMPRAIGDPNRRETCERVAMLLAERSDTAGTRWAGTLLGATLGWSEERLDVLETHRLAGEEALEARAEPVQSSGFTDPTSCAALKAEADGMQSASGLGEVAAAELAIAQSGRTERALAAEQRKKRGLPRGFKDSAITAEQMLDMRAVR